ncbi:MAG: hypothetical protein WH035_04650 [Spirochaetota bacterium]
MISFLTDSEIWTSYRTKIDLLEQRLDSSKILDERLKLLSHQNIINLINSIDDFENQVVNSHKKADLAYLIDLALKNGFGCCVSKNLGKFRGPGKKDDICPYATLLMLKLLSLFPDYYEHQITINSIDSLLNLWENSKEKHPYMFYMGNDFRKLKFPFIWYDILHLAEVLSYFEYAKKDKRFINIIDTIISSKDENGFFLPQSIWTSWKDWDFSQKKKPSSYITFIVYRILKRVNIKLV